MKMVPLEVNLNFGMASVRIAVEMKGDFVTAFVTAFVTYLCGFL